MIGSVSIRLRVLGALLVVLILTLIGVGFMVDATFASREKAARITLLKQRADLAAQIMANGGSTEQLLTTLTDNDVHALVTPADTRIDPSGDPVPKNRTVLEQRVVLEGIGSLDNAILVLWIDPSGITTTRQRLDTSLVIVAVVALLIAALVAFPLVDVALKPLEVMADRARSISQGERGIRMGAQTPRTEVGRTAFAIDGMLDELEGAKTRARAAEKAARASAAQMQSFLSDAAHELKTPLAGIQAAAESLLQLPETAPTDDRQNLEFLLAREASRGGHLVQTLLEAARVDAGVVLHPEVILLTALAITEQDRLHLVYPRLDVFIDGGELVVQADRHATTSVLRNLVDNAARAAAPDGWVLINLRELPETSERPAMAEITVADSGPGIAPEDRERVFERLVRLREVATTTKGSGLGLAIARGYARAQGGDVVYADHADWIEFPERLDGEPDDDGACFVFTLPLLQPAPADAGVAAARTPVQQPAGAGDATWEDETVQAGETGQSAEGLDLDVLGEPGLLG